MNPYKPLFKHLEEEHRLILVESEMEEIKRIVQEITKPSTMKQLNFGTTNGVSNDPNTTVVHCPTQELAQKVLRIADSEWCNGKGKIYEKDEWADRREETCYNLERGSIATRIFYENNGYAIIPAEEFIRLNTVVQPEINRSFIKDSEKADKVFNELRSMPNDYSWDKPDAVVRNPFRVGDRLFNAIHYLGWVTVTELIGDSHIKVGDTHTYHIEFFSFTAYTLQGFSQERPKPEIKEGQLIYVKRPKGEWKMKLFSHWDNMGQVVTFRGQDKSGGSVSWPEYSLTNPLEEK